MVIKRTSIIERLKALDTALEELAQHQTVPWEDFRTTLSQQWIVERGLIACASIIFDVADHILSGHFGYYSSTYEESLASLQTKGVISPGLYRQLQGLSGFRNILVHRYLQIDTEQTFDNYHKGMITFPEFAREILDWLDGLDEV